MIVDAPCQAIRYRSWSRTMAYMAPWRRFRCRDSRQFSGPSSTAWEGCASLSPNLCRRGRRPGSGSARCRTKAKYATILSHLLQAPPNGMPSDRRGRCSLRTSACGAFSARTGFTVPREVPCNSLNPTSICPRQHVGSTVRGRTRSGVGHDPHRSIRIVMSIAAVAVAPLKFNVALARQRRRVPASAPRGRHKFPVNSCIAALNTFSRHGRKRRRVSSSFSL